MSVGKGSIQRAAKAKGAAEKKDVAAKAKEAAAETEEKKAAAQAAPSEKKETVKKTKATPGPKKNTVRKTVPKKETPVAAASVISSDDIHEKKFEAVSHIYCELPIYLL